MAVERFEITSRSTFAGGTSFGRTGPYTRVDGVLHFAVDPDATENRAIVDLGLAERGSDGLVRFPSDFCVLTPESPDRGNHRLLVELPNRGRKLISRVVNRAATETPPTSNILPGDGFLYRHGYTVAWIGWQWDVIRSEALMGLEAPSARIDGQPVSGKTIVRFQPNELHFTHLLADRVHQPYPTSDVDDPDAVLTVREWEGAPPVVIPRGAWCFGTGSPDSVTPDSHHVFLEGGFQPGRIYEVTYTTNRAPVVGCGLLAIRDGGAFLRGRYSGARLTEVEVEWAFAFGMSQTGRMLRHFLFLGMNRGEDGRAVYDGVIPHVGGARRGEFNHRFGQPSVQSTPGPGHLPPFDDQGLFAAQRAMSAMPKVMQVNSSAEYWRGDCALLHVDATGSVDLHPQPDTRIYHFSGTQHGTGAIPLTRYNPNDGGRGRYGFNCVDYSPLLRAAIANLDRWVSEGVDPPPSSHPRIDDGTAVPPDAVFERFDRFSGIHLPDSQKLPRLSRVDAGDQIAQGIVRIPVTEDRAYPVLVSAVDENGNEAAGIRLPDLTVPVGTHTGWNPRAPETGGADRIMSMQGSTFFFAPSRADREAAGDPRPSLEERYTDKHSFEERVREAALDLVASRYLLEEDVDIVVSDSSARYEEATRSYTAFRTPS